MKKIKINILLIFTISIINAQYVEEFDHVIFDSNINIVETYYLKSETDTLPKAHKVSSIDRKNKIIWTTRYLRNHDTIYYEIKYNQNWKAIQKLKLLKDSTVQMKYIIEYNSKGQISKLDTYQALKEENYARLVLKSSANHTYNSNGRKTGVYSKNYLEKDSTIYYQTKSVFKNNLRGKLKMIKHYSTEENSLEFKLTSKLNKKYSTKKGVFKETSILSDYVRDIVIMSESFYLDKVKIKFIHYQNKKPITTVEHKYKNELIFESHHFKLDPVKNKKYIIRYLYN